MAGSPAPVRPHGTGLIPAPAERCGKFLYSSFLASLPEISTDSKLELFSSLVKEVENHM